MLGLNDVVDGIFGGSPWGLGLVAVAAAVAVAGPRAKPVAKGAIKSYLATTEIYTLSLHDALPISSRATVPTTASS